MSARETVRPLATATPQPEAMHTAIPALRRARPGLITGWHLGLLAIVYIRQSTPQQILDHRESRERQYALANYAAARWLETVVDFTASWPKLPWSMSV